MGVLGNEISNAKLLDLEKRVKLLESLKKDNLALFGRSYSLVGSSDSDFLIKTKGLVKVLWGTKFIDLIKDGKINVDSSFLFKVKDYSNIGVKDGIYILDDESIYLRIGGGEPINLVGEVGSTFVSFMGEQETDSESKHTALTNIGFLYSDISKVDSKSLLNGIIYIESEQKLYIVLDGVLTTFSVDFPNPFTEQFVVAKSDSSKGAILIKGEGINNSLAFELLFIYNEYGSSYIESDGDLIFKVIGDDKVKITNSTVEFLNNEVVGKMFKSPGATSSSGFRLYVLDGESTLEVDNLVLRNSDILSGSSSEFIHPSYWYHNTNVISKVETVSDPSDPTKTGYITSLRYENTYEVGECIYVYVPVQSVTVSGNSDKKLNYYKLALITLVVESIDTEDMNAVVVSIDENAFDVQTITEEEVFNSLVGSTTFSVGNKNNDAVKFLRRTSDSLDIIESANFEEELDIKSIRTRVGKISDLDLKINVDDAEEQYDGEYGIYSDDGIFLNAAYKSDYELDEKDDSSRLASTEWVNNALENALESFMKDINLNIDDYPFESVNVPSYLNNADIQALVIEQEDNTTKGYTCNFGTLTISKLGNTIIYAALVRSKLKDGTYSYRTINALQVNGSYTSLSTYLIQPLFNPGYYWSNSKNGSIPVNPTYIGTTYEGFTISESLKYLWYTNDGDTWALKGLYVAPDPSRLYMLSTARSAYTDASSVSHRSPAGFICCYKNGSVTDCGFGLSNYVPVSYTSTIDLSKLTTLLSNALTGMVPQKDGYLYLWSISSTADKTVGDNWKEETSLSAGAGLELVINNADWGNQSDRPGWTVWEVDSDNKIIGSPDSSVYTGGNGDKSHWENEVWRLSFLREILSFFLLANEASRYNPVTGWYMNYEGCIFCSGFGGVFTARIGGVGDPTSDDPNDIGYKPTCVLNLLSGYAIGYGYKADFSFKNVKLGEKYDNLASGLSGLSVGYKVTSYYKKYFKVSYESFSVNLKKLEDNTVNVE